MKTAKDREEAFWRDLAELLAKHKADLNITDDGMQCGIAEVTMMNGQLEGCAGDLERLRDTVCVVLGYWLKKVEEMRAEYHKAHRLEWTGNDAAYCRALEAVAKKLRAALAPNDKSGG